jgi:hypothetical protein
MRRSSSRHTRRCSSEGFRSKSTCKCRGCRPGCFRRPSSTCHSFAGRTSSRRSCFRTRPSWRPGRRALLRRSRPNFPYLRMARPNRWTNCRSTMLRWTTLRSTTHRSTMRHSTMRRRSSRSILSVRHPRYRPPSRPSSRRVVRGSLRCCCSRSQGPTRPQPAAPPRLPCPGNASSASPPSSSPSVLQGEKVLCRIRASVPRRHRDRTAGPDFPPRPTHTYSRIAPDGQRMGADHHQCLGCLGRTERLGARGSAGLSRAGRPERRYRRRVAAAYISLRSKTRPSGTRLRIRHSPSGPPTCRRTCPSTASSASGSRTNRLRMSLRPCTRPHTPRSCRRSSSGRRTHRRRRPEEGCTPLCTCRCCTLGAARSASRSRRNSQGHSPYLRKDRHSRSTRPDMHIARRCRQIRRHIRCCSHRNGTGRSRW